MHESNEHDIFFGGGASGVVHRSDVNDVAVTTIGIDVGTTTFHFMFSALYLHRDAEGPFRMSERKILWRSPVYLTPYQNDRIDASAVALAVALGHQAARIPADHVESGAIIFTGEALRAENAQSLAKEIGTSSGNFVSVSAGHHLEAMLAAFGSGAIGVARERKQCLIHVDIGGGTTKFAVIDPSGVRQTAAISGGGRPLVYDRDRRITRITPFARALAQRNGFGFAVGEPLEESSAQAIADALADAIAGIINQTSDDAVTHELWLTPSLGWESPPEAISFSGGVSEYLYGREQRSFGDVGMELAQSLRARIADGRICLPLVDPGEGIRATVIGAAQSTTQMSHNSVPTEACGFLPVNDVPVVHPHLVSSSADSSQVARAIRSELDLYGLGAEDEVALSITWEQADAGLRPLARGIREGLGEKRAAPTFVLVDQPISAPLETALREEWPLAPPFVCVEGLHLSALDYLDIGRRVEPSGVLPVVVKSLLFDVHHHGTDHEAAVGGRSGHTSGENRLESARVGEGVRNDP